MRNAVFFGLILCVLFISCSENTKTQSVKEGKDNKLEKKDSIYSIEHKAKRYIENLVGINAAENYKFFSYKARINRDTLEDHVFIVQRAEFAEQQAEEQGRLKNFESLGYSAAENYLFVYDKAKDKFIVTTPIGANVRADIEVKLLHLTSPAKLDIEITYRLLNGAFKSYYCYTNGKLLEVLNFPYYTGLGEKEEKAYMAVVKEGNNSVAKDILLYDAELSYTKGDDMNYFQLTPELNKTERLALRFIFDPKRFKYVTPGYEN